MNWNHEVPKVTQFDGAVARVWAGNLHGVTAANPTPDSWANDPENDVGIWYIDVSPGSEFTLPKSTVPGAGINRAVYIVENGVCTVAGEAVTGQAHVTLDAKHDAVLAVPATTTKHAEFLVLQGKAIGEPVAQHGPFVMNTETEIRQAFADYRRTQFGGWPVTIHPNHFVFRELENTDGVRRPPLEGGWAHPISVLSIRQQATSFMLTCAHSDDSSL